jgi:SAM-dependent methyltransferase
LSIGNSRYCPICGWTGHSFLRRSFPEKPAAASICPQCRSSERHRFAYLALRERLPALAHAVMHVAPEPCVEPWLRSVAAEYTSVDLNSPKAMVNMSITALEFDDGRFTLIWCSHVLEHVEDDAAAMAEFHRVLRPGGMAVIMVPVYGETTYENPAITDPRDRLKHFKQEDHVRLYGLDVLARLERTGFAVEVIRPGDLPLAERERCALEYPSTNEIFLCLR